MRLGNVITVPVVVLPCLDEAGALPWVLGRLPPGYRAIVADNGSSDGSALIARTHGAQVVEVPQRGFGAACHAGLLAAETLSTDSAATDDAILDDDVVCFLDADATLDPRQLPRVADPVLAGAADLVLGRRRASERAAWPLYARAGNAELARRLRRRTGYPLRDLGPMRAARRSALLALSLTDRRFGYPLEMVTRAAECGWRVLEVDVDYLPRAIGTTSKVTGTLGGTIRAVRDMSRILAR